ncbi:3'-5' exonuclease [Virgibacillus xinjiangensis]|uniref:3'-5' exonuclease n=1 Tax=Virgibacillus xinjiangensis TaxID=393090 RepID=A0ABV7CQV6_9BACI
MKIVSIDFETANEKRFSPCAVGVVVANEYEIEEEYYRLINPLMPFNRFNTRIHGITERDVEDAPTFAEMWPELNHFLTGQLVVAHNASFDMSVIRQTLDHYNLEYPEMDYLCTANISKKVWPELQNHKLNTVAEHHGISFEHHHALEDARVAAKVFMQALRSYETDEVDDLLAKCRMSKGRIYERGYHPPKSKKAAKSRKIYF